MSNEPYSVCVEIIWSFISCSWLWGKKVIKVYYSYSWIIGIIAGPTAQSSKLIAFGLFSFTFAPTYDKRRNYPRGCLDEPWFS